VVCTKRGGASMCPSGARPTSTTSKPEGIARQGTAWRTNAGSNNVLDVAQQLHPDRTAYPVLRLLTC
jgi:hypothetical protein